MTAPFCVLSIVDNRTFKRLSYHVLDRDPTQVDIAAFLRRFRQALEARGLTVQGITTDGSDAVPRTDRRSLRCGAASGLPIPHTARGEQGDPLGRGPGTQASGSRRPQIAAGPSQLKGGQACRWRTKRIKQKVGELFARHRYLFVQRRLSPSERATLQRICRGWPQLRQPTRA